MILSSFAPDFASRPLAALDRALRLPRPGPWMIGVKRLFSLILIGVAEYYLVTMGQLIT